MKKKRKRNKGAKNTKTQHILQYENRRVDVHIDDQRPDDMPFVQVLGDFEDEEKDYIESLVKWLKPILKQYRPYIITFGDDGDFRIQA